MVYIIFDTICIVLNERRNKSGTVIVCHTCSIHTSSQPDGQLCCLVIDSLIQRERGYGRVPVDQPFKTEIDNANGSVSWKLAERNQLPNWLVLID